MGILGYIRSPDAAADMNGRDMDMPQRESGT
jgi:hypothetical protein